MDIKQAALSLNDFDKAISTLPNNTLKRDLKEHISQIYHLLLADCQKRNQARNFQLSFPEESLTDFNRFIKTPA